MDGKEFNISAGQRVTLQAEADSGLMTINADAQVENTVSTSTTMAPSGAAVTSAINAASAAMEEAISNVQLPEHYFGKLDLESELPPDTSEVARGEYFEIQELDVSHPGYSGRAIWSGVEWDIIRDDQRHADGTTITYRPADGALQVAQSVQDNIESRVPKNGTDRLMTAEEGNKLTGIASGAQVNQNAFGILKFGNTNFSAASEEDTFTVLQGENILFEVDIPAKTVTIKADKAAILANAVTAIKVNGVAVI